ncbi:hypothetical protein [Frondihabitans sucicola]|uniref:hypothetical protein n=1 Tax=Frondihabitans sucicola TaxID=1268041 RepID=UPI0025727AAE|nr:hypothetical protein [Frondihabitans sucicola]
MGIVIVEICPPSRSEISLRVKFPNYASSITCHRSAWVLGFATRTSTFANSISIVSETTSIAVDWL